MIFGRLSDLEAELDMPSGIKEALDYVRKLDLSKIENRKYVIDGDRMFMIVSEYSTLPASERTAEQHKRYIDIHCLARGEESIGFGKADPLNKVIQEYYAEKDASLFSFVNNESFVILGKGDYAVFFPSDIHRPGCMHDKSSSVRKIVIKIAAC